MDIKQSILEIITRRGPVLPIHITKELGLNTIIAGACLSELVGSKRILISNIKIGSSPLYLLPEQREKLTEYSDRLKGPEKEAYELIREKKIIRDEELSPRLRVALSQIKDFAKKIEIIANNQRYYFWKWTLLSPEEVKDIITNILAPKKEEPKPEPRQEQKREYIQDKKSEEEKPEKAEEKPQPIKEEEPKPIERKEPEQKKLTEEKQEQIQQQDQKKEETAEGPLLKIITKLREKGIIIKEHNEIKKREYQIDAILKTQLSSIEARIIYREKKATATDVSNAFIEGQKNNKTTIIICKDFSKKTEKKADELGIKILKASQL